MLFRLFPAAALFVAAVFAQPGAYEEPPCEGEATKTTSSKVKTTSTATSATGYQQHSTNWTPTWSYHPHSPRPSVYTTVSSKDHSSGHVVPTISKSQSSDGVTTSTKTSSTKSANTKTTSTAKTTLVSKSSVSKSSVIKTTTISGSHSSGKVTTTKKSSTARSTSKASRVSSSKVSTRKSSISSTKTSASSTKTKSTSSTTSAAATPTNTCAYWLDDVKHQGVAAFNADPTNYQVYRNVKDFGAKGDGITDDAPAINRAISSGNRCAPGSCQSTTVTPAVIYFPPGVYMINSTITDYYYTQLIGNPNCLPTIRAFSTFTDAIGGVGLIDGVPYGPKGLTTGATNVFWRQIRNFIIDTTLISATTKAIGIHWPTGQATSIQNVVINMNSQKDTLHQGIFIEEGSGGFIGDIVFNGGNYGGFWGNQQFTMRNITARNVKTAIYQIWDWGWTYQNLNIINCTIGLDVSNGGPNAQTVGSVTVIDSKFTDVEIAVKSSHNENSKPIAGGSIVIENVQLTRVGVAVQGPDQRVALAASPQITGWSASRSLKLSKFDPDPRNIEGAYRPLARPAGLITTNGQYYTRTKPQYANVPASGFLSARDVGALGDGKTDDTVALQAAIILALAQNKILFIDHGDYLVKSTIFIPAGARIVGEAYSVILSTGAFFNDIDNPQPVVQIGAPGEVGSIEWSDTIVSTQGQQRGAVLIQYNLASPTSQPSGLWDVHTRIGGFAGSELLLKDCPTTPKIEVTASNLNENCIAAYMSFHITPSGSGLYLENVWLWVADHDIEDAALTRITVYAGRGFLDQSTNGDIWLIGTSVEHHVKYEYQFANTRNVYMGQIQTETAYYQPNPNAQIPFPAVASLADPIFPRETITTPNGTVIPAADGWGLRIYQSQSIAAYGAGLYSFFNNYSTSCSDIGSFATCQNRIFSIEQSEQISFYNLNTVGTHFMVSLGGVDYPRFSDLDNGFISTLTVGQVQ